MRYLSVFGDLSYKFHGIDFINKLEILKSWLREKAYKVGRFWQTDILDFDPKQTSDVIASFGFI